MHKIVFPTNLKLTRLYEYCWLIEPVNTKTSNPHKEIDLVIMGLVHGDEIGGVKILNDVLGLIQNNAVDINIRVVFLLGNPNAAIVNKRYIDSDLNRSFGVGKPITLEERRANEIEEVLCNSFFLLDIHQTQLKSEVPFFISKYDKFSFQLAHHISPNLAKVTYFGTNFSKDGFTSVNFILGQNGYGIGIELGEKGDDPYQIELGISCSLKAIKTVEFFIKNGILPKINEGDYFDGLYAFAETIQGDPLEIQLNPGLTNFMDVRIGQELGKKGNDIIKSNTDGKMLFPKYRFSETDKGKIVEICRILKKVGRQDVES